MLNLTNNLVKRIVKELSANGAATRDIAVKLLREKDCNFPYLVNYTIEAVKNNNFFHFLKLLNILSVNTKKDQLIQKIISKLEFCLLNQKIAK